MPEIDTLRDDEIGMEAPHGYNSTWYQDQGGDCHCLGCGATFKRRNGGLAEARRRADEHTKHCAGTRVDVLFRWLPVLLIGLIGFVVFVSILLGLL